MGRACCRDVCHGTQTIARSAAYHAGVPSPADRLPREILDLARAVSTAMLSSQLQKHGFVHCLARVDGPRPDS